MVREILFVINTLPGWAVLLTYSLSLAGIVLGIAWHPIYEHGKTRGSRDELRTLRRENADLRRRIGIYQGRFNAIRAASDPAIEEEPVGLKVYP